MHFVDTGKSGRVSICDLCTHVPKLTLQIPSQALQCNLDGVTMVTAICMHPRRSVLSSESQLVDVCIKSSQYLYFEHYVQLQFNVRRFKVMMSLERRP